MTIVISHLTLQICTTFFEPSKIRRLTSSVRFYWNTYLEIDGSSKVSIESSVTGDFDVDYCQIGFMQNAKSASAWRRILLLWMQKLYWILTIGREILIWIFMKAHAFLVQKHRASQGDVSWTFVIDLDRIIFTVDWHAHFDLFNVALGLADEEDWFDYLRLDGRGCRCLDRIHHGSFYHPQCRSLSSRFLTQPSFRISPSQES